MASMTRSLATAVTLAAVLAACATRSVSDERAVYERHAGEPVDMVEVRGVRSWADAGNTWIVIETRGRDHYLLTLEPRCLPDVPYTQKLALDRASGFRLRARFDHVRLVDQKLRCRIETIRPLDYAAVRAELDAVD